MGCITDQTPHKRAFANVPDAHAHVLTNVVNLSHEFSTRFFSLLLNSGPDVRYSSNQLTIFIEVKLRDASIVRLSKLWRAQSMGEADSIIIAVSVCRSIRQVSAPNVSFVRLEKKHLASTFTPFGSINP